VESDESLFLKIIEKLDTGNVLQHIVLIGSWVLPLYKAYFDDDPEVPVLRTTDVDFLLEMPPNISNRFDIPIALLELGFEPEWSIEGDYCKYVHPDMEVEFLIPELGRGIGNAVKITELGISAQPLRFLSLAHTRSMYVTYHGYNIRVPEPEVFVLLKLLILPRRKDQAKRQKDASTARALGEFLLKKTTGVRVCKTCSRNSPKGGRKRSGMFRKTIFLLYSMLSGTTTIPLEREDTVNCPSHR